MHFSTLLLAPSVENFRNELLNCREGLLLA